MLLVEFNMDKQISITNYLKKKSFIRIQTLNISTKKYNMLPKEKSIAVKLYYDVFYQMRDSYD